MTKINIVQAIVEIVVQTMKNNGEREREQESKREIESDREIGDRERASHQQ